MEKPHNPLESKRSTMSIDVGKTSSDDKISIVIVHRDRPEYLNLCIQSVVVTSSNNNYEIIVVDNGSDKESQEFLDSIEDQIKVVRNQENLMWAEAANKGAEAADKNSKYIVFLHHDVVILNPSWLDLFINVSESQNAGIIGLELQSYEMQNQQIDYVQEWCMMVRRDCWNDIGPFDVRLPQVGAPFAFTIKAQTNQYKPQILKTVIAHHYRIFALNISEYERQIEIAWAKLPQIVHEIQSS